jgi:phosphoglycerol transferase MdoB-like AlkP superfamily enzyme
MNLKNIFSKRFIPAGIVFFSFICASVVLRLALMIIIRGNSQMKFWEYIVAFFSGLLYDISVAFLATIPFLLYVWFQNELIYKRKVIPYVVAFFLIAICLLIFTSIIPKEYNELLHKIITGYIAFRFVLYLAMAFLSVTARKKVRLVLMYILLGFALTLIFLNTISEWLFWEEFSTRYNFIAVDYLIYTNEVIGNIRESYPIGILLGGLFLLVFIVLFFMRKYLFVWINSCETIKHRTLKVLILLIFPVILYFVVQENWRRFSNNEYANELAGNGIYQFAVAFKNNDLDFYKFYKTLPDEDAFKIVRGALKDSNSNFISDNNFDVERNIVFNKPEKKMNVVLISVESLSADFMRHFGNKLDIDITPFLDSLADKSLFFTNHYASGTRTVRGLEALTLSIPPVPGQSIVKRPDNANMFSLGSVFKSKGYTTQFIYGGYSYFDNMKAFFEGNGYEVIDRSAIKNENIHYQNIWGVADEDEFTLAINTLDKNAAMQKPFFTHIMTVSNHRPFTYPDGRINIPSAMQIREGAVKYTDYCINKFLKEASIKPWFNNTIFVIVSDHCASSAGSKQLPVNGYHIPLLIYSPANIQPAVVSNLTAQIDIAPTILGLLNFSYKSKFFGQDMLNTPEEKRRAFISTYQGLGYLKNNQLIVQSPLKKVEQFIPDFNTGNALPVPLNDSLSREAIAFYQTAVWLVQHKKYHK